MQTIAFLFLIYLQSITVRGLVAREATAPVLVTFAAAPFPGLPLGLGGATKRRLATMAAASGVASKRRPAARALGERRARLSMGVVVVLVTTVAPNELLRPLATTTNGTVEVPGLRPTQVGPEVGGPIVATRPSVEQTPTLGVSVRVEAVAIRRPTTSMTLISVRRTRTRNVPVPVGDGPTRARSVPTFPTIHSYR